MFGIHHFSAIINPPQCAILAVGGSHNYIGKLITSDKVKNYSFKNRRKQKSLVSLSNFLHSLLIRRWEWRTRKPDNLNTLLWCNWNFGRNCPHVSCPLEARAWEFFRDVNGDFQYWESIGNYWIITDSSLEILEELYPFPLRLLGCWETQIQRKNKIGSLGEWDRKAFVIFLRCIFIMPHPAFLWVCGKSKFSIPHRHWMSSSVYLLSV